MITGLTRVRNESLIIADTVQHLLAYCNHVILYDDCSTDSTVEIAQDAGGSNITIIRGDEWRKERTAEETRHRAILLDAAKGADWCLYLDADERLVGDLPPLTGNGFRFRLFDGYLAQGFRQEYTGGNLADLPRLWGPEYRDILMLFRASAAHYAGLDRREPIVRGPVQTCGVKVKHFGKCLSVEQWEETCEYYATHFPEPYKSKWNDRRGKAIHEKSDFGRTLFRWSHLMRSEHVWRSL